MAEVFKEKGGMQQISEICFDMSAKLRNYGIIFTGPEIKEDKSLGIDRRYTAYRQNVLSVNPIFIENQINFYIHMQRTELGYFLKSEAEHAALIHLKKVLTYRILQHITAQNGITSETLSAAIETRRTTFGTYLRHSICDFIGSVCALPESTNVSTSTLIRLVGVEQAASLGLKFAEFMQAQTDLTGLVNFNDILESKLAGHEKAQLAVLGIALDTTNIDSVITEMTSNAESVSNLLRSVKDITWEMVNFAFAEAVYREKITGED